MFSQVILYNYITKGMWKGKKKGRQINLNLTNHESWSEIFKNVNVQKKKQEVEGLL